MIQTIIVGVILAATLFFAIRWLVRSIKGKGGCGCGCNGGGCDGCPYAGKKCSKE